MNILNFTIGWENRYQLYGQMGIQMNSILPCESCLLNLGAYIPNESSLTQWEVALRYEPKMVYKKPVREEKPIFIEPPLEFLPPPVVLKDDKKVPEVKTVAKEPDIPEIVVKSVECPPGYYAENDSCYPVKKVEVKEVVPEPVEQEMLSTGDFPAMVSIYFSTDSFALTQLGRTFINDFADSLVRFTNDNKNYKNIEILITGYADSLGSEHYNDVLSHNRAVAAKEYLETIVNLHELKNITYTINALGRQKSGQRNINRRVDIAIKKVE